MARPSAKRNADRARPRKPIEECDCPECRSGIIEYVTQLRERGAAGNAPNREYVLLLSVWYVYETQADFDAFIQEKGEQVKAQD